MHGPLVNFSFYRFLPLGDPTPLAALREKLRALGHELGLRGTILLAQEGVNVMVSGEAGKIARFEGICRELFGAIETKTAPIAEHSFHRLLVKIKKEIISVGDSSLVPAVETAPRISPAELKKWFDQNRTFLLLDTRNAYEIEVGAFRGTRHLGIDASSEFSERVEALLPELKDQTVVTVCTGGIRCEKASSLLLRKGVKNLFQLNGGILRYLEENGAAHFEGNCFVYDWRLAVDGNLQPVPRSADPDLSFGRHRLPPSAKPAEK